MFATFKAWIIRTVDTIKKVFLFDSSEIEILLVQCILNEVLSYKDYNLFYFVYSKQVPYILDTYLSSYLPTLKVLPNRISKWSSLTVTY